jgi:hypothetical protein
MKKLSVLFSIIFFTVSMYAQTGEKRIALVIGNSDYTGGAVLKNPVNDANLMATTLQELNFTVIKCTNASRAQMTQAIAEFWSKLGQYNVALFYFAGHGLQVNGVNYLIPVDAKIENKDMVAFEAISVNDIASKFEEYKNNINILILDACRNNPFRSWARGGERGFKVVNPPSGTIIAFATSEGATAADGSGNNGLFTEQLAIQLKQPVPIEKVFKLTRIEVERLSNGQQSPQEWSKLTGDFYFTNQAVPNSNENIEPNEVVFNPGNVEVMYGSISIDSKMAGDLYLDNKKLGYIKANSKGNKLNNIPTGNHVIEIRGAENFSQNITIDKDRTTYVSVKSNRVLTEVTSDNFSGKYLNDSWTISKTGSASAVFSNSTISLNTSGPNTIMLYSNEQKSVNEGKLIFTARLYTYEDNNYAYGPLSRGLVHGTDRNNAIEFINIDGSTIQVRTVSQGIATTTNYSVGASVANFYNYKIIATESKVDFYFNETLIATHTTNIPTLPLNMYFDASTWTGNVPQTIDDAKLEIIPN